LTVNLNFLQYFVCLHGRINYINWCITLRLCWTVVCLRRMQVGAWGQSPSLLVWRHHMRHAVVQNSSGRQVVWCRRTAALNKLPALLQSFDSLSQFRRQLKTFLFVKD